MNTMTDLSALRPSGSLRCSRHPYCHIARRCLTPPSKKIQLTGALAASPMSVTPPFFAFVPVSYGDAALVCAVDMGADAAAHVVGGWASPCTLTVVKNRPEAVVANAMGTRRSAINASKPANTQAKKWSMRPLGVQGVPPG